MWRDKPCKLVKGKTRPKKNIGGRKTVWMARWILEQTLGRPIRPKKQACHHCNNDRCIEPTHIFEGTPSQNYNDGNPKWGAKANLEKTHCPQGHELSGDNLYKDSRGWRGCVTCRNETSQAYYERSR